MKKGDFELMKEAIRKARRSKSERPTDPLVGAVLLTKTGKKFTGCRGEKRVGDHAEYTVLEKTKARTIDLTGATLFTTLEPCTTRNHPKVPCAQRILDSRITKVWIGMLDPNPDVYAKGIRLLECGGVDIDLFPKILRDEIKKLNSAFIDQFDVKGQLELKDYWSTGTIENISYVSKSEIRRWIWGGNEKYDSTELQTHRVYMDEARNNAEVSQAVTALARIFPHPADPFRDAPIGLRSLDIRSSILLKNPSKSSPIVFMVRSSTTEQADKDWLRHGLTLAVKINPGQTEITLDPDGYAQMTVTVRLELKRPLGWSALEDIVEQDLVAGQALKDWVVNGIERLHLHIRLLNGTDFMKEFGLKVIDETGKLSSIENIDTNIVLKNLSEIRSWIDRRSREIRKDLLSPSA